MSLFGTFSLRLIQHAYRLSLRSSWKRFISSGDNLEEIQMLKLRTFLSANKATEYGRRFNYETIDSVAEFRRRVPIVTYDDLDPYVSKMASGEQNVLCSEPIELFEQSSGSTSGNKLIPYNRGLLAEFAAATNPWIYNLYSSSTQLLGTTAYWSVSPAAREKSLTAGGIPIGFEDDTSYFGPMGRWALEQMLAVSGRISRIADVDMWRNETAIGLLASENLGFISVWSPTFLTLMMQYIESELDALCKRLPLNRAKDILRALDREGDFVGTAIWPKLGLISSWTDGPSQTYVSNIRKWFPTVPIQGKGLLATEGVVSIPLFDPNGDDYANVGGGALLAAQSHFFEFISQDSPDSVVLAHQLQAGQCYCPLMTTSNGFARYNLKDRVKCLGYHRGLPILSFVGKEDMTSDLFGEKVTAMQVDKVLRDVAKETGISVQFAMLAPHKKEGSVCYELYIESSGSDEEIGNFAAKVDDNLSMAYHYNYCRDLGQLGPVRALRVKNGWQVYQSALVKLGSRMGDIKPTCLDRRSIWGDVYRVDLEGTQANTPLQGDSPGESALSLGRNTSKRI